MERTTVAGPEYRGIRYRHLVTSVGMVMCDRAAQAVEGVHFRISVAFC